jgi:hypothetical protein
MSRHFGYFVLLMIASACRLQSQYYFYNDNYYNSLVLVETGFAISAMNCLTDLGGKKGHGKPFFKDINWENTHLAWGVYLSVLYDQVLALRAEATFGKVSAYDNVLKNDRSEAKNRYNRNLHFESNITEACLLVEFHPLSIMNKEGYAVLSPYLLAGTGIFKFDPRARINNHWVNLQPLSTEGQGFREYPGNEAYKLVQINFPAGLGLRYEVSALVNVRLEMVYRFLQTDYLDDVSTRYIDPARFYSNLSGPDAMIAELVADRSSELLPGNHRQEGEIRGNPKNNDGYFSCNLKIGLILNRKRR